MIFRLVTDIKFVPYHLPEIKLIFIPKRWVYLFTGHEALGAHITFNSRTPAVRVSTSNGRAKSKEKEVLVSLAIIT